MKSFTIENKLVIEQKPQSPLRWLVPFSFLIYFIYMYIAYSEIHYASLLFVLAYTFISLSKPSKEATSHTFGVTTLEFGENNLLYKSKDSIIWHIPFKRLKKIQSSYHGSGGIFSPKMKEVLVLTNDNDSYSIIGSVPDQLIEEIQNEIEIAIKKVI